jgi:hypothetical protein
MKASKDHLERRCPRLGGPVTFEYCRTCSNTEQHCWKIIDCWWEHFDIVTYLKNNLPEDQFDRLVNAQPKPKISSLVDLVEQIKKRQNDK